LNKSHFKIIGVFYFLLTDILFAKEVLIEKIDWRQASGVPRYSNYVYRVSFDLPGMTTEELEKILHDKSFLETIPYHSRYNGTTTRLYDQVDFNKDSIDLLMQPFEPFSGTMRTEYEQQKLIYTFTNASAVKYKWFPVVGKKKLFTQLEATSHKNGLTVTGDAGLKTYRFFSLFGKRIEWAIEGRILALFYALAEVSGAD